MQGGGGANRVVTAHHTLMLQVAQQSAVAVSMQGGGGANRVATAHHTLMPQAPTAVRCGGEHVEWRWDKQGGHCLPKSHAPKHTQQSAMVVGMQGAG